MSLIILIALLTVLTFSISGLFPFVAARPKLLWAITLLFPIKACLSLLLFQNENIVTAFLETPIYFSDALSYHEMPNVAHEFSMRSLTVFFTDPGFPTVLYYVVGIFRKFSIFNVTHEHLLLVHTAMSHMILPMMLQILYSLFKSPRIALFGFILTAIDMNFLVYSCVLLRELETALFYLLIGWALLKNRWILLILLLIPLSYLRKDSPPLILLCLSCCAVLRPMIVRYPLFSLISLLTGAITAVQLGPSFFPPLNLLLFGHLNETIESGFGAIILHLPPGLRLIGYSVLGLVGCVPTYPFFAQYQGVMLAIFGMGLGNITYFAYHIILFQGLLLTRKTQSEYRIPFLKLYFFIMLHHLLFIGLIFNTRHRIQFLPWMIIALIYTWLMAKEKQFTLKTFFGSRAFILSLLITLTLNILYLTLKAL